MNNAELKVLHFDLESSSRRVFHALYSSLQVIHRMHSTEPSHTIIAPLAYYFAIIYNFAHKSSERATRKDCLKEYACLRSMTEPHNFWHGYCIITYCR